MGTVGSIALSEHDVFGAVYAAEGATRAPLEAVAREFSPRIEIQSDREITLDLTGLTRLFGDARSIAEELRRTAADRGLRVRVAIASTRVAARLMVRHRAGITVIHSGTEAVALAPLPLGLLSVLVTSNSHLPLPKTNETDELLRTLRRWGLRTLGELAALPSDDVAARLGQDGIHWQRLALGHDPQPLVPAVPEERFEQALELEWPIDGLEPLSFVLGRLMEPLSAHLARCDRGAAVLHVRLHLVTREIHERSLQLPAPMRDARALRTLAVLDLESHPPAAAIDRVIVAVDPTPGRVIQFSLLTRPLPAPERLSTLMARLGALMGEGRCGSPAVVDTWRPGAFVMQPFAPRDSDVIHHHEPQRRRGTENKTSEHELCGSVTLWPVAVDDAARHPIVAIRRCRIPIPVRVRAEDGQPTRVMPGRRGLCGGGVKTTAGPWRTTGAWWTDHHWNRDEWDVTLHDGTTYRVFHERDTDAWFLEGIVD